MAKLIGNEPNQVPTNGDLGTMAFQNTDHVVVDQLNVNSVAKPALSDDWSVITLGDTIIASKTVAIGVSETVDLLSLSRTSYTMMLTGELSLSFMDGNSPFHVGNTVYTVAAYAHNNYNAIHQTTQVGNANTGNSGSMPTYSGVVSSDDSYKLQAVGTTGTTGTITVTFKGRFAGSIA